MATTEATRAGNGAAPPKDDPPEASPAKSGLYAKLVIAASSAGGVAMEGKHSQGWSYARAEDVIREAQKALNGAGLIVLPTIGEVEKLREYKTSSGAYGVMVQVEMLYRVIDPETGESEEMRFLGTGSDAPGDKAIYKGVTGANKYFYAGLLGIPFGSDPEEGGVGEGAQSASRQTSEPPVARLNPERTERILGGFKAMKMSSKAIGLMLGACNIDAPAAWTADGIKERISGLGEVEADKLEVELEKAAQDAETEAPDERPESDDPPPTNANGVSEVDKDTAAEASAPHGGAA